MLCVLGGAGFAAGVSDLLLCVAQARPTELKMLINVLDRDGNGRLGLVELTSAIRKAKNKLRASADALSSTLRDESSRDMVSRHT